VKNTNTTKISLILGHPNSEPQAPSEQNLRTLTNEEILSVAGGPEVDVEAGGGGG
jgi:hypothetical protein